MIYYYFIASVLQCSGYLVVTYIFIISAHIYCCTPRIDHTLVKNATSLLPSSTIWLPMHVYIAEIVHLFVKNVAVLFHRRGILSLTANFIQERDLLCAQNVVNLFLKRSISLCIQGKVTLDATPDAYLSLMWIELSALRAVPCVAHF